MKKGLLILIGLVIVGSIGLGIWIKTNNTEETTIQNETKPAEIPDRPADINGNVQSIEGNELVVAHELKETLSEEEQAAEREERQTLSQEERQALRQEVAETIETELKTIIIPVGVPIYKSSGTSDGDFLMAELSEISVGTYISMWVENDEVMAVKIKGTN